MIEQEIDRKVKDIDQVVGRFLPKEEGLQKTIFSAMDYSVKAGGKRLRPMLMMETARMFGNAQLSISLPYFMAAIEMIHTYSLVHDDLPAMDGDRYRRGKETTWVVYGDAMGVLAGDALLNYAYELIAEGIEKEHAHGRPLRAFRILSRKAGAYGMVGGQTVDVEMEGKKMDLETLKAIHSMKTCALIEASMMVGAVLEGATEEELDLVEKSGHALGMAFQIQDDILDVTGDLKVMGKPAGSDEKNGKQTYVNLFGLEGAKKQAQDYTDQAVEYLEATGRKNAFLPKLIRYLMGRDK